MYIYEYMYICIYTYIYKYTHRLPLLMLMHLLDTIARRRRGSTVYPTNEYPASNVQLIFTVSGANTYTHASTNAHTGIQRRFAQNLKIEKNQI